MRLRSTFVTFFAFFVGWESSTSSGPASDVSLPGAMVMFEKPNECAS